MHDVRALNELVAKESAFTDTLINEVGKVIVGRPAWGLAPGRAPPGGQGDPDDRRS